jgi:hypothetical protein
MRHHNYKRILRKDADFPENVYLFEHFENSFIKNDFPYLIGYYGSPYTYSGYIINNNNEIDQIIINKIVIKFDDGNINFKIIDLLSNDFPFNDISIIEKSLDGTNNDIASYLEINHNIQINKTEVLFSFKNINIDFEKVEQIDVNWEIDIIYKSKVNETINFEEYYYREYKIDKVSRFTT